ncbi:hypothetical protein FS837_004588 [Tulasnella sp. UAMH 9824]|nr:hypothetical protein FS837_004588 [Tulasnella sp. UAMH 9824]
MDRVQVLGDEDGNGYGHTGCINALSWSQDGTTLVSSGDDCRICIWRPNASPQLTNDSEQEELFQTSLTLTTGHTNNVFSIKFLPYTADMKMVTCSADREVRVFDLGKSNGSEDRLRVAGGGSRRWYERPESQCCVRVLNCHTRRVKRIVTEDSSDLFLTVSEDHTVRQHDLRTPHHCRPSGNCPAPLVKLPYSLSALASSAIAPYYFVVAGEASFGHLFDRRMVGRILKAEWGQDISIEDDDATTRCVRRFGRLKRGPKERKSQTHVTGARMADSNGHDLLLSYSADAAYLYDIRDAPYEPPQRHNTLLPNNEVSRTRNLWPRPSKSNKRRKLSNGTANPDRAAEEELLGIEDAEGEPDVENVEEPGDNSPGPQPVAAETEEEEEEVQSTSETSTSTIESDEEPASYTEAALQSLLDAEMTDAAHIILSEDDDEDSDYSPEDEEHAGGSGDTNVEEDYVHEEEEDHVAFEPLKVPMVMPRRRFAGMSNVRTVKDVNFLGPKDEYVTSGSDDGHFFIWKKENAELVGVWDGDGSVVNVIEDRPAIHSYPMVAVSGIDNTVKLFAPTAGPEREFNHTGRSESIIDANQSGAHGVYVSSIELALLYAQLRRRGGAEGRDDTCRIM